MNTVRIAAAQTAEYRENLEAALACLVETAAQAEAEGASLLCLPEGFLQGYLTDQAAARRCALDLSSPAFEAVLEQAPRTGPVIVLGMIEADAGRLFNSAVVIHRGVLVGRYRKAHLLDGEQVFTAGEESPVFEAGGVRFGINICYDTNFPEAARKMAAQGASLIVCPANNMMKRQAAERWKDAHNAIRGERCRETGLWLISADVFGEREGRVGWGPTAVLNPAGEVAAQLPLEAPGLLVFDLPA
jgi:predicted amidohydrolase